VNPLSDAKDAESLRDLVARLIDTTRAYLKAEIVLAKARVRARIGALLPVVALVLTGMVLAQASLAVLIVAAGALFARWIGWAGGLALAGLLGLLLGALLAWAGYKTLKDMIK
jgi:hypothetical protein